MSNRRFGTTDLAIVMGLWSAMAVLLGGVLSELASDVETPLAKAQSEAYALQLAEKLKAEPQTDPTNGGRAPASAIGDPALRSGSLGKDPWGQAYQYKIVPAGVVVWSVGKNSSNDSVEAISALDGGQPVRDFHFNGDDVGFVKPHSKALTKIN
jgi:hypothetical protein